MIKTQDVIIVNTNRLTTSEATNLIVHFILVCTNNTLHHGWSNFHTNMCCTQTCTQVCFCDTVSNPKRHS